VVLLDEASPSLDALALRVWIGRENDSHRVAVLVKERKVQLRGKTTVVHTEILSYSVARYIIHTYIHTYINTKLSKSDPYTYIHTHARIHASIHTGRSACKPTETATAYPCAIIPTV